LEWRLIPANRLEEVYDNILKFSLQEDKQTQSLLKAKTVKEIKKAWSEIAY